MSTEATSNVVPIHGNRITAGSQKIVYAHPPQHTLERRLQRGEYQFQVDGLYKLCTRCSDYWPADSEFFYASKSPDGLTSWCKACYIEWRYPNGRSKKHQKGLAA